MDFEITFNWSRNLWCFERDFRRFHQVMGFGTQFVNVLSLTLDVLYIRCKFNLAWFSYENA